MRSLERQCRLSTHAAQISPDIAKGGRGRYVPVVSEAIEVVENIKDTVGVDQYVIPARRPSNPPLNTRWREYPDRPSSPQAIWRTVAEVADRAGIAAHIHPHLLRHAFGITSPSTLVCGPLRRSSGTHPWIRPLGRTWTGQGSMSWPSASTGSATGLRRATPPQSTPQSR
jgi:hypothetical protein